MCKDTAYLCVLSCAEQLLLHFHGHSATVHPRVKSLFWPFFSCGYTLDQYHFKPGFHCGSPYCYIHTQSISILSNTRRIQLWALFLVHIHNLTVPGKRLALTPDIYCLWFTTNHPNSSACNNVTTQFISSPNAIWILWCCETVHELLLLLIQCHHHTVQPTHSLPCLFNPLTDNRLKVFFRACQYCSEIRHKKDIIYLIMNALLRYSFPRPKQ